MLENMSCLLTKAKKEHYGILAACSMNRDQIRLSFEAANELHAPLIVMKHASVLTFDNCMDIREFATAAKHYSQLYPDVHAALGLDHGNSMEDAVAAIQAGYTGVMIDKSMMPLATNIAVLKKIVRLAHAANVAVEAGLGGTTWRDPTPDEILANLTNKKDFALLTKCTGVDAVAVFVGGSHGDHKDGTAILHYDLIEQLRDLSPAALVMHGCSATGDKKLARAAKCGLSKFNVAGDLTLASAEAFIGAVKSAISQKDKLPFITESIQNGYKERAKDYITFLGSSNKS